MNKKKLLALLLALVMTFSLVPVTALAAEGNAAKIGDTEYASLAEAVEAATAGQTITLLEDVSVTETVTVSTTLTLDTNGKTITNTNANIGIRAIRVLNGATLTVTGGGSFVAGEGNTTGDNSSLIDVYGTLNVNGNVSFTSANACIGTSGSSAVVNIYEATMNAKSGGTCLLAVSGGTINVYGLSFYGDETDALGCGCAWAGGQSTGTINIYGGTFYSVPLGEAANQGEIPGTNYCLYDYHDAVSFGYTKGTINVYGGEFISFDPSGAENTADTSNFNHSYVADGYKITNATVNGVTTYSVVSAAVAKIGETNYATLADAVEAVPTDGTKTTITMIGDETLTLPTDAITIAAGKNVTLDLNGHVVGSNCSSGNTSAMITNNGTLVIEDSQDTNSNGTGGGTLIAGADPVWVYNGDGNYSGSYASNLIKNTGTLTIQSGYLATTSTGVACYAIDNYSPGSLTVNGGKVENTGAAEAIRMFCNNASQQNTVLITGGVIIGKDAAVWLQQPSQNKANLASLTITGGTIEGTKNAIAMYCPGKAFSAVEFANTTVNISGGYFASGTAYPIYVSDTEYGSSRTSEETPTFVSVTGGYYDEQPGSAFIASGYEAVAITAESDAAAYTAGYRYKVQKAATLPTVTVDTYSSGGYSGYVFTPGDSDYDSAYATYLCNLVISFDTAISSGDVKLFSFGASGAMTPVTINKAADANDEIEIIGDILQQIKVGDNWVTKEYVTYAAMAAALSSGFPCGVVSYPASLEGAKVTVKMVISNGTDTQTLATQTFTLSAAAQIGTTNYTTLEEAYDAAEAGNTIKLLADITYDANRSVPVWKKSVNINLDGHTLTTNSGVGKNLSNMGYTAAAICFAADEGSITISNGTINTAYGAGVYVAGHEVTLSNLTINAAQTGTQSTAEYSAAVRITSGGKVIIESGSYSGAYAVAVSNSGGEFVINGGTFTGKDGYGSIFFNASTNTGVTKSITINDGKFSGDFVNANKGTLTISGGHFTADPSTYLAAGYERTASNEIGYDWTVTKAAVAQIGDEKYTTLAAAAGAIPENGTATIKLLADIVLESGYTELSKAGQTVTLDLNGKAITGGALDVYGTLTVKDSSEGGTITGEKHGIYVNDGGTLNIFGGTVTNTGVGYPVIANPGTVNISGGTVTNATGGCAVYVIDGTLDITGGTVTSTKDDTEAVAVAGTTVATISGGTVTGHDWGVTVFNTAKLTVSGSATIGTAENEGYAICTNGNKGQNATVIIEGGTITGKELGIYQPSGKLIVSGGSITGATGVYFKSNSLSITGGTIIGNGAKEDYDYNGNGANYTGDALVIDSCGYPNGINDVSVSGGSFQSTHAKAVACYTYQQNTPVTGFITGGKYSSEPDSSYVATGYKAASIENAPYHYQVGYVTVTADEPTKTVDSTTQEVTQYAYTVSTTVTETESTSSTMLEQKTNLKVNVTGTTTETTSLGEASTAVAKLSNVKEAEVSNIISSAIEAAGTKVNAITESADIVIKLAKSAADTTTDSNDKVTKVTYEVHPEAIIYVNSTEVGTVELANSQITGTFSFKLYAKNIEGVDTDDTIQVTHIHDDGTSEVHGTYTVDNEGYITVENVSSFSEFTLEEIESGATTYATFGYTISLEDSINIVYNVKNLTGTLSNYTVTYTDPDTGEEVVATPTNATHNSYVIAKCAAKEMGDTFSVVVKYNGEQINSTSEFSIKGYCDTVISGNYGTAITDLCKATLDYGRYAQETFNYETSTLVNGGSDYFVNSNIVVPAYAATKTNVSSTVTSVSLSLVTTSKTQLVAYFTMSDVPTSITVNDIETTWTTENGKQKVVVEGIAAKDLDKDIEIVVKDYSGSFEFTVSPVDYMGLAVTSNSQVAVNRAFYNYYLKAATYFAAN